MRSRPSSRFLRSARLVSLLALGATGVAACGGGSDTPRADTGPNGGTVIVVFRAIVHPDEVAFGKICSLVMNDVTLSLKAPAPENVQQLFGEE